MVQFTSHVSNEGITCGPTLLLYFITLYYIMTYVNKLF